MLATKGSFPFRGRGASMLAKKDSLPFRGRARVGVGLDRSA